MTRLNAFFVWIMVGMLSIPGSLAIGSQPPAEPGAELSDKDSSVPDRPTLLLVEQDEHPSVTVRWMVGGQVQGFTGTMPYTAPTGGQPIGKNVKCYVTMGGTRIETGAGHPKGAVIRLGVTKIDSGRAFFAGLDPNTEIEFAVSGVRFNQPVKYHQGTGMMHLKYALGDLKACALPGTARNQYLLSDPDDTLGGRINPGINATPGALDGQEGHGSMSIEVDPDDPTRVSMRIVVPYGLLRHLQDPWKSDLPGTFFEPIHMHAEAEVIPVDAQPLVRDPIVSEANPNEASEETDAQSTTKSDESDPND